MSTTPTSQQRGWLPALRRLGYESWGPITQKGGLHDVDASGPEPPVSDKENAQAAGLPHSPGASHKRATGRCGGTPQRRSWKPSPSKSSPTQQVADILHWPSTKPPLPGPIERRMVRWVRRPRFCPDSGYLKHSIAEELGEEEEDDGDVGDHVSYWDPYAVLGLPSDPRPLAESLICPARRTDIHNAYLELSRRLHPDVRNSGVEKKNNLFPWIPLEEQYKAITAAHKLLMDPYLRARYHLSKNLDDNEVYSIMAAAKQARAVHEVEHMQFQYEDVVAEQEAKGGLVIVRALYGEVVDVEDGVPPSMQDLGDVIDVTVPVQILVQRTVSRKTNREVMKIELSDKSKVLLPGFYDPVYGFPKQLLVRYKYRNKLHQVVVGDTDKLRIPLPGHAIPAEHIERETAFISALATSSAVASAIGGMNTGAPLTDSSNRRESRRDSRRESKRISGVGNRRESAGISHTHVVGRNPRRRSSQPGHDFMLSSPQMFDDGTSSAGFSPSFSTISRRQSEFNLGETASASSRRLLRRLKKRHSMHIPSHEQEYSEPSNHIPRMPPAGVDRFTARGSSMPLQFTIPEGFSKAYFAKAASGSTVDFLSGRSKSKEWEDERNKQALICHSSSNRMSPTTARRRSLLSNKRKLLLLTSLAFGVTVAKQQGKLQTESLLALMGRVKPTKGM